MKKELILTEDDFYTSPSGRTLRGGSKMMYESSLVVLMKRNGEIEVLKDREGRTVEEIKSYLEFDERLILAL
jgi:hypothetical protein